MLKLLSLYYSSLQRGFSCTAQVLFLRTFVLKLGKAYEQCNRAIEIIITKTVSLFHANTQWCNEMRS